MNGKLVRDKIPEIIATETGKPVKFRVLTEDEYKDALHKKLDEEVAEFHQSGDVEELVDILHVIVTLAHRKGYTIEHFINKCSKKERERGTFDKRYFLYADEEDEQSAKYPLRSRELCDSCRYGMTNDLCRGNRDCATCEMRDKPESPTHKNGRRGCYCLSLKDGEPCKYYTPVKEEPNDKP